MIEIEVNKYYGNRTYYSVMPDVIFDALEFAFIKGDTFVSVPRIEFEKMVELYKIKMNEKN